MKLMELYAVQDVFASALGRVDVLGGGFARFVFYVERQTPEGTTENIIVASLILPLDKIPANRLLTDAARSTARHAQTIDAEEPVLVH